MKEDFFKQIAEIMKKHGLVRRIDEMGRTYYIEFQTKPMIIDGETRKYTISGCSKDKKSVYEAMLEIHDEFHLDKSLLINANYKELEEYVFHFPHNEIDGKFSSFRRV